MLSYTVAKNRIWGWNWLPVQQTKEQINAAEHKEVFVKQLVDASLPSKQQLREPTKAHIGHYLSVGNCHIWVYVASSQQKVLFDFEKNIVKVILYILLTTLLWMKPKQQISASPALVLKFAYLKKWLLPLAFHLNSLMCCHKLTP